MTQDCMVSKMMGARRQLTTPKVGTKEDLFDILATFIYFYLYLLFCPTVWILPDVRAHSYSILQD